MKVFLLTLAMMLLACGPDEEKSNQADESAQTSLWSDSEMQKFLFECNNPEGGVSDSVFQLSFCSCTGEYLSKRYTMEQLDDAYVEIIAQEEPKIFECAEAANNERYEI